MADHLSDDVANKVLRQVEFYFSDSNLPRDDFLRKCVEGNEEGLVSLPLVCSFSRMRNHLGLKEIGPDKVPLETTAAVAEILRKSSSLRVSDDGQRVGRVSKLVKADEVQEQVDSRTIAAGPLPYNVKLEDVEGFFSQHGKVNSVRLPRHSFVNKAFCGVALVEFSSDEEAANIIQSNLVFDGANLDLKSKKDFDAERQALEQNDDQRLHWLRHEKFGVLRANWQEDERADVASENDDYPKGLIIAFNLKETSQEEAGEKIESAEATNTENFIKTRNGDHSVEAVADAQQSGKPKDKEGNEQVTREDIKNVMKKYGTVKYVDYTMGEASGFVRFEQPEGPQKARTAAVLAKEGGLIVKNYIATLEAVEGDTERGYWAKLREGQTRHRENVGRGHRGRGGRSRGGRLGRRQVLDLQDKSTPASEAKHKRFDEDELDSVERPNKVLKVSGDLQAPLDEIAGSVGQ